MPDEVYEEFPELFLDVEELTKAPPPFPPRKANGAGANGGTAPSCDDEEMGSGGDSNASLDPGADQTDDSPQNLIEMMVRLASIIVVVGGSIPQADGGGSRTTRRIKIRSRPTHCATGWSVTARATAIRQQAPAFNVPLEKIPGAGEAEVDLTVADVPEELIELRKNAAEAQTLRQE